MAKRKTRGKYHGYIVIDKPAGMTSHDVVGRVRRLLGERRVGHAGTLDPAAVGVLPIAVGLATRTVEYLSDADKAYIADVTFGVTTDSADGDGTVTAVTDPSALTPDEVEAALDGFRGEIEQVPPMHSAIKIDGVPLYERARRGESIELEARPVTIHELRLLEWDPPVAAILVHCSKGTYVRSLARDLGDAVGTGAYMSNLVRVMTGPFTLQDAMRLDELESALDVIDWPEIAAHPDASLVDHPAMIVDATRARSWRQGNPLDANPTTDLVRVYDGAGEWLGVGWFDVDTARVKPVKVVAEEQT